MVHNAEQPPHPSEKQELKDLHGLAKALIVSMAWSYADAVEKFPQTASPQELSSKSPEDVSDSERELKEEKNS